MLWEYYHPDLTAEQGEQIKSKVEELLTDLVGAGRLLSYVEANPPDDEVEEYNA